MRGTSPSELRRNFLITVCHSFVCSEWSMLYLRKQQILRTKTHEFIISCKDGIIPWLIVLKQQIFHRTLLVGCHEFWLPYKAQTPFSRHARMLHVMQCTNTSSVNCVTVASWNHRDKSLSIKISPTTRACSVNHIIFHPFTDLNVLQNSKCIVWHKYMHAKKSQVIWAAKNLKKPKVRDWVCAL